MNPDPRLLARPTPTDAGVSYYSALYLAGLLGVLLVCFRWGMAAWSFLPFAVGVVGLVTRFGGAILVWLASVAVLLNMAAEWYSLQQRGPIRLADLVLGAAVLVTVLAHYRLQSLAVHVFPPDPRLRPGLARRVLEFLYIRPAGAPPPARRSGALVSQREIGLAAMSLLLWAGLAQLVWSVLPVAAAESPLVGVPDGWWRVMLLAWLIGLGLWVTAGLFGYWQRRRMTPAAATLFLQDVVWRETHREQRAVNRWLAWARLRRQRRKDNP